MRFIALNFLRKLVFNYLPAIPYILSKRLVQLWQFIGLLLFEAPSCLLCQVQMGVKGPSSKSEGEGESLPAKGKYDCLPLCQSIEQAALITRAEALLSFGRERLCVECMTFFCDLTEVKTTLIGDDDGPAMSCFSSGFYNGPLQEAVYQIKYLKRPELAGALAFAMVPAIVSLLQTLAETEISNLVLNMADLIVPVPLHKNKFKERGFNQAEELAIGVGRLLDLKVDNVSLKRIRPTRPQFGLSRGQRRRNLQGAFVASKALAGKRVILVDDILTSGATIYECALAVSSAGGIVLGAITLARAKWQRRGQLEESSVVPAISLVL